MYQEIIKGLESQVSKSEFELIKNSNLHLGVFTEPYLSYILDGTKTIESRFSKKKTLPFNNIGKDDIVFIKKSGGDVVAYFKIDKVLFLNLDEIDINEVRNTYGAYLCVDDDFWELKRTSKYATLIFIKEVVRLKHYHINKRGMNTWIKLKEN